MTAPATTIRILVEVDKKKRLKIEFDTDLVTGLEIKTQANIPTDNDLARRVGQKLELVTNDEKITIKNGDQFVVLPPGTIS